MTSTVRAFAAVLAVVAASSLAGCTAAVPRRLAHGRVTAQPLAATGRVRDAAAPSGHRHQRATATGSAGSDAPRRLTGRPDPMSHQARPRPCAGNHGQLVRVSLRRQHLWMCAGGHLVKDTPITSGMAGPDTATPTGNYVIQGRNRNTVLTLNTGAQYAVKYWIPFDAPLYGFHDSSWQHFPYGSPKYRKHGSHGCVHMPLRAIAFLYRWAHIGAAVRIRG